MARRLGFSALLSGMLLAVSLGGCAAVPPPTPALPAAPPAADPLANHDLMARSAENEEAVYRADVVSRGGHGTGFVVSSDGYLLTCHHVADAGPISVMLYENGVKTGKPLTYQAKLVAKDEVHDLALLKLPRTFRQPVLLSTDGDIRPGDEVYNIGYPYDYGRMVSRGFIMRKGFSETTMKRADDGSMIHVLEMTLSDIHAGPGTSGSPVFLTRSGKLIGVMRLMIPRGRNAVSLMVVKAFTPVTIVEQFLRNNRVPYLQSDGTVATYPPLPAPVPAPVAPPPPTPPAPPPARVIPALPPQPAF